jgi:formyl-CoA transferase
MCLADAGAEVVKIERPDGGDPRRTYRPIIGDPGGDYVSGGFLSYNRNKKSVALDLKSEKGREIFKELVRRADVIVENMGPGTMDRLGLGYEALRHINPRIVYAAISGFGRLPEFAGPYSERPAFDTVILAMSGIMHIIGTEEGPPLVGILGLADIYTGLSTAYQIMLALYMREKTGEGRFIDAAMYDALVSLNERSVMLRTFTGEVLGRGKDKYQYPAGAYKCRDRYVAFITPNDQVWARLCNAIGRPDLIDDPRTSTGPARSQNSDFVDKVLEDWMSARDSDEVVEILNANGVPAGPVQTAEDLVNCPQLRARRMLIEVEDPIGGKLTLVRTPLRMTGVGEVPTRTAPRLGEHTDEVLRSWLGLPDEEIEVLRREGVIK